jgi:hypothetical protein
MESSMSLKCPNCKAMLDEVSYEENVGPIEYASFVLGSGKRLRGSVKKYICSGCFSIHNFFLPF